MPTVPRIRFTTISARRPPPVRIATFAVVFLFATTLTILGGCGNDKPSAPGVATATGLGIVTSDYKKTSISLYDPVSGRLSEGCVNSAEEGAIVAQPLSGDVGLPSRAQSDDEIVLIDRKNAVLTFVDPTSCTPRAQLSVTTGGFEANPHDVIHVSAHKAYVTRYGTNPAPTGDLDRGDDVLVIDPLARDASQEPILKSISLSAFATSIGGTALARPDRGILVDGKVYLTLGNLDENFVAGAARVAVIDTASDAVVDVIDLPDQKGCSAITYVAATNRLYVSCGGAFSDLDQAAGSALVEIDLSGVKPVLGRIVAASKIGSSPLNFASAAVLGGTAFVGTLGVLDSKTGAVVTPDAFYAVALATGAAVKLLEGGAYNFGGAAVDTVHRKVFLPDGDAVTPRVHVFDVSADAATTVPAGVFEADPTGHLPPREIAWY
jgi:hypothetical protein